MRGPALGFLQSGGVSIEMGRRYVVLRETAEQGRAFRHSVSVDIENRLIRTLFKLYP